MTQPSSLGGILEELSDAPDASEGLRATSRELMKKLNEKRFLLVVIGQFNRGKTSVINALLGEYVLPTGIVPVTSIVTTLTYGTEKGAEVAQRGMKKVVPLEELPLYVTEEGNPRNGKNIESVTVFHPSDLLRYGVEIVDTPGIASVHEHNTDVTECFLPNADAVVFVVSVDPPLTLAECAFLEANRETIPKMFFVLNKTDMVQDREREESLHFTQRILQEKVGLTDVHFHSISAKLALENMRGRSGIEELRHTLVAFFREGKEEALTASVTKKTLAAINREIVLTELEAASLRLPLNELEDKIGLFGAAARKTEQRHRDNDLLLHGEVQRLIREVLDEDVLCFKEETTSLLLVMLDAFLAKDRTMSGKYLSDAFERALRKWITEAFRIWRAKEEEKLRSLLDGIFSRFTEQTNILIAELLAAAAQLFHLDLPSLATDEVLTEKSSFWFKIGTEESFLDSLQSSVLRSLPCRLSRILMRRRMRVRVRDEVDRHCGRSRFDFLERIEESARVFWRRLDEKTKEVIAGIEGALQEGELARTGSTAGVATREQALQSKMQYLSERRERLEHLYAT